RLNGEDKGSGLFSFYNFRTGENKFAYPSGAPSNIFINAFDEANDIRKNALLMQIDAGSSFYYVSRKFDAAQTSSDRSKQHINPLILRASEVYLNRAEAYIAKKQPELAAADIKAIQGRARNLSPEAITLPESDIEAM